MTDKIARLRARLTLAENKTLTEMVHEVLWIGVLYGAAITGLVWFVAWR